MASIILGPIGPSLTREDDGNRTYHLTYKIKTDVGVGPLTVLLTPGLPVPGALWNLGTDVDHWAWCKWGASSKPVLSDESSPTWTVEFTFSTKPDKRCQSVPVENPLLEPTKISGGAVKYQEEASYDRFGNPIQNSAFQPIKGPTVEFDADRHQIKVERNVPILDLPLLEALIETVNDSPLWGLPARCVKFSTYNWSRKFYGQCGIYYTLSMDFDIRGDTFDRSVIDKGTKVLSGHWDGKNANWVLDDIGGVTPDYRNPQHYIAATDKVGNPMEVILNGFGVPSGSVTGSVMTATATDIPFGGIDYVVGDVLTVTSGTASVQAELTVSQVDQYGEIKALTITNGGSYTVPGVNPITFTGGSGLDAIIDLDYTAIAYDLTGAAVVAGGTNYIVNSILFIGGGTFSTQARLKVATVGAGGVITSVTIDRAGAYTTVPNNPVAVVGGLGPGGVVGGATGDGATFNLTFSNAAGNPETPGTIAIEKYQQRNLNLLGLPADLSFTF